MLNLRDGTIETPTNQPSNTPTQKDIIDEMEVYLMQLEDEINNTNDNEEDDREQERSDG